MCRLEPEGTGSSLLKKITTKTTSFQKSCIFAARLVDYLKRTDIERYRNIIKELGIRK